MPYHVHNLSQLLLPPGAEYPGSLVIGEDGQLTTDYRMEFITPWVSNTTFYPQQTVLVNGWTMSANKPTQDYPAPYTTGSLTNLYFGAAPTDSGVHKQVISGNRYTAQTSAFQIVSYFLYTVVGQSYDAYLVVDPEGDRVITALASISSATTTGWVKLNITPIIVPLGKVFDLVTQIAEPADTPVTVDANYNYLVPQNELPPNDGEIVHARGSAGTMLISYTDNDTTDRTALIQGLSLGDRISINNTIWTVQGNFDQTTYGTVTVTPEVNETEGVQLVSFETVTPTPITYMEDIGYWVGSPTPWISGLISIDDTYPNATLNTNAYGVDIEIIEVTISPDWDIVAPGDAAAGATAALSAEQQDWVRASSTLLEFAEAVTTNNQWVEIARFPVETDKGVKATISVDARRIDAYGIYNSEYAAIAFNNGGSIEVDGVQKFELGQGNLDVRADSDGTDLIFEVKGRNSQNWAWKMAIFFRDIN
jgi:hypothetical protein